MRIVTFAAIKNYIEKHADAEVALRDWYKRTNNGDWTSFADVKKTHNNVDYVGNSRFVFNIKGNHYRLIAIIIFASKKVYIRFIGKHSEYDKIDAKTYKVMAKIKSIEQYKAACDRVEELLKIVDNNTPVSDKSFLELDLISDLVADYEEVHCPVEAPSLVGVIKLRMYERGLNQLKLSELLNVSPSRISDYLTGRSEPPLKVAREICIKLDIDAEVVLGI